MTAVTSNNFLVFFTNPNTPPELLLSGKKRIMHLCANIISHVQFTKQAAVLDENNRILHIVAP